MNIVAFLLALAAILIFVAQFFNAGRRPWSWVSLGLAVAIAAIIAQLIWTTVHVVKIH